MSHTPLPARKPGYEPGPRALAWIGRTFGRWTVVGPWGNKGTMFHVICRCECGRAAVVTTSNLVSGRTSQCDRCGASRAAESNHLSAVDRWAARGRKLIAKQTEDRRRFACVDCGDPCTAERCSDCSRAASVGVPLARNGKTYPETLATVSARVGVTKQRVQQVVAERGWDGMLAYFAERARQ